MKTFLGYLFGVVYFIAYMTMASLTLVIIKLIIG